MEHMTPEGLRQGYFCAVCGESCNLYATGHGIGRCQPNPERVKVLKELNANGAGNSLPNREPTPTPSITVGTQVRLTGVVRQVQPNGVLGVDVYVGCQDGLHWFRPSEVEVIRQPFKRGEVVWNAGGSESDPYVVLNDEQNGKVDVTDCETGETYKEDQASGYERRP